jgi:hypothetical protein
MNGQTILQPTSFKPHPSLGPNFSNRPQSNKFCSYHKSPIHSNQECWSQKSNNNGPRGIVLNPSSSRNPNTIPRGGFRQY